MPAYAQRQAQTKTNTQYSVSNLPGLGGTSSGGNSINNQTLVAGYSRLTGNQSRHAALWRNRQQHALLDLGTLGGPNSSVTWNVKNTEGIVVGISQTADPEPLGEFWSSAAFYGPPNNVGFINLGFVWEDCQMRGLPNFPVAITALPREPTIAVRWSDGRRMMFMTQPAFRRKFCSSAQRCGNSDRQTRSRTYPGTRATHQELLRRSMIMVKLWVFRASATRPLDDTLRNTLCFGKTAE